MCQQHMVRGMPNIKREDQLCEACVLESIIEIHLRLEVLGEHQNLLSLCGPMRTTTHEGNHYFLTFTDDYNRKIWIFLQKEKSATFKCFKTFKAMVENESNLKLK